MKVSRGLPVVCLLLSCAVGPNEYMRWNSAAWLDCRPDQVSISGEQLSDMAQWNHWTAFGCGKTADCASVGGPQPATVCRSRSTAAAVQAAASACGTFQKPAPLCNAWRCTTEGWTLHSLPAGTPCDGGAGSCDGSPDFGACVYRGTDLLPGWVVQSIEYVPPGKQSSISYAEGSSQGSRIQYTDSESQGLVFRTGTTLGPDSSTTFSTGVTDGVSFSIDKKDSVTQGLRNDGSSDEPDRGNDVFWIWTNARLTRLHGGKAADEVRWSTADGKPMQILPYKASELAGKRSMPQDDPRAPLLAHISEAGRRAILALDAPLVGDKLDPRRYQRVARYQMLGPDYPGDAIPFGAFSTSYDTAQDQANGSYINSSSTVLFGASFLGNSVKGGFTFTMNYGETRTQMSGQQKTALITLQTPTVCSFMDVDVYIDAAFGTWLALPGARGSCAPQGLVASGVLTDAHGSPVANQTLLLQTPQGPVGVYTNQTGRFRLFR